MGNGGFIQTPLRVAADPYYSAMKMKSLRLFFSFLINTGVVDAEIPAKKEVFTVQTFGGSNPKNYVSNNFIFSALPYYRELPEGSSTPWAKYQHEQRGVIVTSDKRVFYFSTQDPAYISITDQENRSYALHLTRAPKKITSIPKVEGMGLKLPLIQENVFCASSFPWNTTEHMKSMWMESSVEPVTPAQFVESLIEWRRLTADDVPQHAFFLHSNEGLVIFPSSFTENKNQPLNGVVVLNDGAVMKYFTRAVDAVAIDEVYYIRTKKVEQVKD